MYICYDRHFPEGARILGLNGAEIVYNPSATVAGLSEYLWELEQPAHAVANPYFVAAINRVGTEQPWNIGEFYGKSYFCNPRGKIVAQASRDKDELLVADLNLDEIQAGARHLAVLSRPPSGVLRRNHAHAANAAARSRPRTKRKTFMTTAIATSQTLAAISSMAAGWNPAPRKPSSAAIPPTSMKSSALRRSRRAKKRAKPSPRRTPHFPRWRDTPAPVRGRVLAKAALLMEKQKDEIARTYDTRRRQGTKGRAGEVQKSINILEFMAGEGRRIGGETLPSELPKNFAYTMKQPLGVVGAIAPWNFPVSIPVWKIAPALVAGNTVVFKPAKLTPISQRR